MSILQFLFLYIPKECQKPFKLARFIALMSNSVVLTKENIIKRIPSDNIPLSVTTPTRDLSSLDYVKELVHGGASYQVIPSTHNPFNYNTEDILLGILPKTKNILLDISLPFYNSGNDHQQGYYYGRFLIYNQRLIAVRLSCATRISLSDEKSSFKRWPAKKVSTWKVPPGILRHYKISNFNERTYKREIRVGDFALEFKNLRISLFFESQLKSVQNLLDESLRTGSQIISIVNDTPRDKTMQGRLNSRNYSLHSTIQNQLKIFGRKHKKIVMYCGCRLAPLTELYLANSFILHHELPEAKVEPHFLNLGGTMTLICNIDINITQRVQSQPTNLKGVHVEKVNERLASINSAKPGKNRRLYPFKSNYHGPIPEEMPDILQKMQLWYVYNTINECQPFIFPLPLCQFTQNIIKQFKQICTYTLSELKHYIIFYKQQQNLQLSEDKLQAGIDIYDSLEDLMKKVKMDKYFIYIDNPKNHKSLYNLAQDNPNIIICPKSLMREEEIQKNKILQTIEKRINDFAQKIIDYNIYSFKKILIQNQHSPEPLTKDQLIFAINDSLKNKIRTSFRSHPFYRYILSKNRSQLEDALGQAQILRRQQGSGAVLNESRKSNNEINNSQLLTRQEHREQTKDFFSKLDRMKKYFGNDKKMHQLECHRCQKYVFKNYVTDCNNCNKKTCYFCFEAIKSRPSHPQAYKQCLVCKKLCFCDECTEKKKKQAKQKQKIRASTDQIISLSQTQPQKSLEELEQIRIRKELAEDACQICQIQGREVIHIKVICSQCDQKGCFNCIKSKEKGDRKFIKEWLCDKCRPPPPLRISEEMNVMTMIDEQAELNTPYESAQNQPEPNLSPISLQREPRKRANQPENFERKRKKSLSKSKSPPRQKKKPRSPSQSNSPKRNKKHIQINQPQKSFSKPQSSKRPRSPSHSKSPPRKKNQSFQQPPALKHKKPRSPSNSNSPPRNLQKKRQSPAMQRKSPPKNSKRPRSPSHSNSPKRQKKKISPSKSRSRSRSPQKQRREDSRQQQPQSTSKPLWGKNTSKSLQERSFDKSFESRGRGRGTGQDRGRGGYNEPRSSGNYDGQEENKSKSNVQEAHGGGNLNIQDPNDIDY